MNSVRSINVLIFNRLWLGSRSEASAICYSPTVTNIIKKRKNKFCFLIFLLSDLFIIIFF